MLSIVIESRVKTKKCIRLNGEDYNSESRAI